VLLGALVVRPDLSSSYTATTSPSSQQCSPVSLLLQLLSWLTDLLQLLIHLTRTILVFTPCVLSCPLLLLPGPARPVGPLLQLLVSSLETAGPVYIKLGQWASTRRDLFSVEVCRALGRLQTRVAPHSWAATSAALDRELGPGWREQLTVDPAVAGSGCCAQVHRGQLEGVGAVAVKVVHPGLAARLALDLQLLSAAARLLETVLPSLAWIALPTAVQEFGRLMEDQLDLRREANNLRIFRHNFRGQSGLQFPEPVAGWSEYREVLVEEWVEGESLDSLLEGGGSARERCRLAGLGVSMLLQMVFTDNCWHGDLHPGNLLVTRQGRLCVLDAGIAGSLAVPDRQNLLETFRAIVLGESGRVGELFLERSNHSCQDSAAFVREIQQIVDAARSAQLSLDRVDVTTLLQSVFSTLMRHQVRLDANFSSVVIAIAIVEGLGRQLNPELDLIQSAVPYIIKNQ